MEYLRAALSSFKGKVALQVNLSCPNTGENLRELEREAVEILRILGTLGIPLVPKFNVMTSPATVKRIAGEVEIDAVHISNSIPYGQLKKNIRWADMFGEVSPLQKLGGGGLSGGPLFPLLLDWVIRARDNEKLLLPINAGGGITRAAHVDRLFNAGADGTSIASVIMLRPWRVRAIINAAHQHA